MGFNVVVVENGQEAIAQVCEIRPDVILTDLVMPLVNGVEAVQHMRQIPELQGVIMIGASASVFEKDQQRMITAGCDAFLPKPIRLQQLLDVLAAQLKLEWIYAEIGQEARRSPSDEASHKPLIPPPPKELEALYALTLRGDMDDIQEFATRLEQLDQQFAPFADKLREFAKSFQDEELLMFVQQYREKQTS
jgi:CheY-like chemotaxis protein